MIKVRFVYFYNGSADGEEEDYFESREVVADRLPDELRMAVAEVNRVDAWEIDEYGQFIGECIGSVERKVA